METWIHFNESGSKSCLDFVRAEQKSCQVHVHLLNSNIFGIKVFFHCYLLIANPWILLCHSHSQFYVLHWHSSSLLCQFFVCFLVCHVCLRVTITSSTQGKITGYLPRAQIWIGHFFVYHTCKKVRITYKYVIITYTSEHPYAQYRRPSQSQ